jgi:hypothetical protein
MQYLHIELYYINLKHHVSVSFFSPPYHHNFLLIPYWNYDFKTFEFEKRKRKSIKAHFKQG